VTSDPRDASRRRSPAADIVPVIGFAVLIEWTREERIYTYEREKVDRGAGWLGAAGMSRGESGGGRRWSPRDGIGLIGGVGKKSGVSSNVPLDKIAIALGLRIPQFVLIRADEVIH